MPGAPMSQKSRESRSVVLPPFSTASNSHVRPTSFFSSNWRMRASDANRNRRLEQFFECFDLTGKAPALVALHDRDDFSEFGLIPWLPRCLARGAPFLPVVHVEPLDVADAERRLHLPLALDEDGLDVAALHADGDGDLIEADAGVAGGMFREEGQHAVALQNAVGDGTPPFVAELDLGLVEPDVVPRFSRSA